MKTADFFSAESFAGHLERRRTPSRLALLSIWSLLILAATFGLEWEVNGQELEAQRALTPNAEAQQARAEMDSVFADMNPYVKQLDALAVHLSMPQAAALLQALPSYLGPDATLEEVDWHHAVERRGLTVLNRELVLEITAIVRGEQALLSLPKTLQEATGFASVKITRTEVLAELEDYVRVQWQLRRPLPKTQNQGPQS
jgi:hypothetical protein